MSTMEHTIWSNYFDLASAALNKGRPDFAVSMFAAAVAETENFDLSVGQRVASLHGLACAYLQSGRKESCEVLLRKALRIIIHNGGTNIEELSRIACRLADTYLEAGEAAKAMPVLKVAARQIIGSAGEDSPSLVRLFKRMAFIYGHRGRPEKAARHFARAKAIELELKRI